MAMQQVSDKKALKPLFYKEFLCPDSNYNCNFIVAFKVRF